MESTTPLNTASQEYTALAKGLHWLLGLALVATFALGLYSKFNKHPKFDP